MIKVMIKIRITTKIKKITSFKIILIIMMIINMIIIRPMSNLYKKQTIPDSKHFGQSSLTFSL